MAKLGTALVWDSGLYPYAAVKLAEGFDTVLYYTPYSADSFPVSRKTLWGKGLPGVTRVNNFWDCVDEADLIMFPDLGAGDMQMWLRQQGKRVWGGGAAEVLEQDRVRLKQLLHAKKMPLGTTWIIEGIEALRNHLEGPSHDNQYVKIGEFRGDFETYHHVNSWLTKPWADHLAVQLGPIGEEMQFIVEAAIEDAVEVGYDGICVDGQFPNWTMYGYEEKDAAYVGHVCATSDVPLVLRQVNEKLAPILRELGCRSLFSTELRVTEDGTGFLIDPCVRFPSPPSGCMMEAFSNWPEVWHDGGMGQLRELQPVAEYAAELVLRSDWAEDGFLALRFPEENRRFVKLHGHAIVDGTDYVVSLGKGMPTIGSAVGLGSTVEEAVKHAIEVADSIEGQDIDYEKEAFDDILKKIEEGASRGIQWT